MGNLQADTEVSGANGRYGAKLSPDWDGWVPNGGLLVKSVLGASES